MEGVCVFSKVFVCFGFKKNNNNLLERWWVVWHFGSSWGVLGGGAEASTWR